MMTRTIVLGAALLAVACGGGQDHRRVKSQQELLDEQLAMADEDGAESAGSYDNVETDSEQAEKFDKDYATHELKRATLNAQQCPDTFEAEMLEGYEPGTAQLSVTFTNDGSTKEVVLQAPYVDTTVGNCVYRAMKSVHVKTYVGPEQTMEWEIELAEANPVDTSKKD